MIILHLLSRTYLSNWTACPTNCFDGPYPHLSFEHIVQNGPVVSSEALLKMRGMKSEEKFIQVVLIPPLEGAVVQARRSLLS